MPLVDVLEPVVQPYAWGSTVVLAEIQGRPSPSPGPEAELWVGAHPAGPSVLRRDQGPTTLDAIIAADPLGELGAASLRRFGSRLPFLLKILAAEQALSIQVHPDQAQAEAGFHAENARGTPIDSPERNYVDDWPKPELLCALTPFEALAGFRPAGEAADLLDALDLPELVSLSHDLRTESDRRTALSRILNWPAPDRSRLLERVVAACSRLTGEFEPAAAAAVRVAVDHPGDMGILASLLLRHLTLEPGEALVMPAGGIHAYLHGVGIEVLANSDNVVRAGLTPKHVDIPELLRLVDPAVDVPRLRARELSPTVSVFDAGVPEFCLYRLDLTAEPTGLPGAGPRLVLCVEGEVVLEDESAPVKLPRGGAAFVPAADGPVTATGPAVLFAVTVG
jgi:mannose-6-phosphate isomerase